MKRQWIVAAGMGALLGITPAWAQHSGGHGTGSGMTGHGMMGGDAKEHGAAHGEMLVDAEVRKVDKDAGKITLRHGPIKSLDMPAMTMVYRVKDPTMLERVKAGDKVKFSGEMSGSAMIVTKIEPAS